MGYNFFPSLGSLYRLNVVIVSRIVCLLAQLDCRVVFFVSLCSRQYKAQILAVQEPCTPSTRVMYQKYKAHVLPPENKKVAAK